MDACVGQLRGIRGPRRSEERMRALLPDAAFRPLQGMSARAAEQAYKNGRHRTVNPIRAYALPKACPDKQPGGSVPCAQRHPMVRQIDRPLVRNPNGRQSCPMVRASDDRWSRDPTVGNGPNGHRVGTSPMVVFPARQNSGVQAGHKVGTGWARGPRRDKARTKRALLSPCQT